MTKRFGGTLAVHEIDLDFRQGEVHALLGANGAGKSTLIKLLAGVHEPDSGEIYLGGQRIDHVRPRPPMAFIHQELGLIEWMTVAENIALVGGFPRKRRVIDWRAVEREAEVALRALGSGIDCTVPVSRLPRTERSIVAIVRALALNSDVLVLDEPTASLPESETGASVRGAASTPRAWRGDYLRDTPPRRGVSFSRHGDRAPRRAQDPDVAGRRDDASGARARDRRPPAHRKCF